ncbi:MAG: ATP-binding cassette domain-containing protein [Clostridia bacterium]|nr:ATP-binding cassette domain-containing protein [Clostridia bacterium]
MITCENLVKIYKTADIEVVALQGLDLVVEQGELMGIIGNSGSGKSTLLNMLGGLDKPSAGKLMVDGKDLFKFTNSQLINYKRDTVGFVWQNNARNLIPYLTALENVELPMLLSGKAKRERAKELLDMVGLSHRQNSKLYQLSGGEQQRTAIAIALANNPKLLLADEPTGAVDTKTSALILDIFRELNKSLGLTIIIVTHDRQLSREVDRVVAIRDGRTSSEFIRKKSYAEELAEIASDTKGEADEESHVELAVLDKSGRLQIPREYIEALGLKNRNKVKVELNDGRIVLAVPEEIAERGA